MHWYNLTFNKEVFRSKPMNMIDLEMAECIKKINIMMPVLTPQDRTIKEVLAVVSQYLVHRSTGADDTARHDIKYANILCDIMLSRLEGPQND